MTPERYCEEKVAAGGSSVYYSVLYLPPAERAAIIALSAFCRELSDAIDDARDASVARARLDWWREQVRALCKGNAQHPVAQALGPIASRYGFGEAPLIAIVDGAQMDLEYNRYPDFATLEVYCDRRAGTLASLCAEVLQYRDPQTARFARSFGIALQLIELLADAGRHARANRVYFPLDELQRFDLTADNIVALREDARFERLMAFQIERARTYYRDALRLLPKLDDKRQRAMVIAGEIERAMLEEVEAVRGRILNQRIALTPLRKFWIAWKTQHRMPALLRN